MEVGECGYVGVVVAEFRALIGEQFDHLQSGGLADVAYVCLVADAEHRGP